ncbi:PAS domain S-box protein [Methylogaea oryzae]|uniref:PAS domain S-box protein n=1 Tax=Methylogaea oryzae TaxID=1295382 RepID=UPI0006D29D87|nr:PAS domain S-box protein [Methylogaea oryzae]
MGFEYVSPRFCELLGVAQEDIRRDPVLPFALVHPDDRDEMARRNQEAIDRLAPFRFECRFLVRGETRWFHIESDPLRTEEGASVWNGVLIDITERKLADAALAAAAEQTRTIVDNILDGIIAIDGLGIIQRFNRAAERIFGYTADEVVGRNINMLMPEPHHSLHDSYLTNYRAGGVGLIIGQAREVEALRKNGERFAMDLLVSEVRRYGGPMLIGIVRDITERKRLEAAQLESEARFRSTFDEAAIGMALVSPEGRFLQANDALCRIVGYAEDELRQKRFQDITHPDDLSGDLALAAELAAGARAGYQLEKRYFHKDGHVVWVQLNGSSVRDAEGGLLYFIAQIQDITERRQADAVLREALSKAQRYSDALDSVPAFIYIKDKRCRYVHANRAVLELFGCSAEDLPGSDDSRFFPPEAAARLRAVDERVLNLGEATQAEIDVPAADGSGGAFTGRSSIPFTTQRRNLGAVRRVHRHHRAQADGGGAASGQAGGRSRQPCQVGIFGQYEP